MSGPALFTWYDREEAIAFFGDSATARTLDNGQWVLFPNSSICLALIGDGASHFQDATRFVWVSGVHVRWGDPTAFVPEEVRGGKGARAPIHLFARTESSLKYRYLGELDPTYAFGHAGLERPGHADFTLKKALPSTVFTEMTGYDPGDVDHEKIDAALDRLRTATSSAERVDVLKQVVEYWHGPIGPNDGVTEAELEKVAMPEVLRKWYRWAGKRREIMSGQNDLLLPRPLPGKTYGGIRVQDDLLVFYQECQCVYQWATWEHGDDPPVFGRYNDTDPWEPEAMTLSEHLILVVLFEAILSCKFGASTAWIEEEKAAEIIREVPPIAIGPWRWAGPMQFYAGKGAFMYTAANGEFKGRKGLSLWVGAKTDHPLEFLKPCLNKNWEYVAI